MIGMIGAILRLWRLPGRTGLLIRCVVVFLFGASHEALNVAWVHYSERGLASRAMSVALVNSTVNLAGISESLGNWKVAMCYVAGEAFGTFVAILLKGHGAQ